MSFVTRGLGVGALVTAGLGFGFSAPPPPPPPPPPAPVYQNIGGGSSGGGSGGGGLPYDIFEDGELDPLEDIFRFDLGEDDVALADVADDVDEEPVVAPAPSPQPQPPARASKPRKRAGPSGMVRAAKVAIGAGMVYQGVKGGRTTLKAARSGDLVGVVKGLSKFTALRKMLGSGAKSVLDGLFPDEDDDDDRRK